MFKYLAVIIFTLSAILSSTPVHAQACDTCDAGGYPVEYAPGSAQKPQDEITAVTPILTPQPVFTPVSIETPTHTNHGNHYGNDKPDNNPKDVKNKHDGCDQNCTGKNKNK